jgi:hypothetical protein
LLTGGDTPEHGQMQLDPNRLLGIREGNLQVHPKICTISTKFCTKVNNFALDSATVHASHQIFGHPMHYCILRQIILETFIKNLVSLLVHSIAATTKTF